MPELSLTGWLDGALSYFAQQAGIPVADYASGVGGEGIGNALELIADTFTKGWFNKLSQLAAGGIASGYGIFGQNVPTRLRKELIALGTHELLRIVQMSPGERFQFQASVFSSLNAAKRGDWATVMATMLKSPQETGLTVLMQKQAPKEETQTQRQALEKQAAEVRRRYQVSPPSMPTGTAPGGRYMVMGQR